MAKQDEKKLNKYEEAIALRGLDIMRKDLLLENALKDKEKLTVRKFFETSESKPNETIVRLIDQAMCDAIGKILEKRDPDSGFVDNELRLFFVESSKAKRVLLDVMLANPEYVPDSWGGTVLVARRRLNQHERTIATRARLKKEEEKASAEKLAPVLVMTPSLEDFLIGAEKNKQESKEDKRMIHSEPPRMDSVRKFSNYSAASIPRRGKRVYP
ncbi:hypothetical protein Aduo_013341 [Ancylostoma duodenale]